MSDTNDGEKPEDPNPDPVPPPPNYGSVPPNYGQSPYGGQPGYAPGFQQTNQKSTWSLVLGIVGFVCCPLLILTGILAIVLGSQAKNEIAQSGGTQKGAGNAKAGVILGWIGVGVFILLTIFYVGLFAAGGFSSSDY